MTAARAERYRRTVEAATADLAPHPDHAAWALSSLFDPKPGESEWRCWHRGPNGPKACKRRADRKRSDRKRRARRGKSPPHHRRGSRT